MAVNEYEARPMFYFNSKHLEGSKQDNWAGKRGFVLRYR